MGVVYSLSLRPLPWWPGALPWWVVAPLLSLSWWPPHSVHDWRRWWVPPASLSSGCGRPLAVAVEGGERAPPRGGMKESRRQGGPRRGANKGIYSRCYSSPSNTALAGSPQIRSVRDAAGVRF